MGGGINTYAYVEGNPINATDPNGLNPAWAFRGGWAIGGGINAGVQALTGLSIGSLLYETLNHDSKNADLQSDIEREANRREYKNRCKEPVPPGLDPCERAKWKLRKAQDCKALRDANTNKWWGGKDNQHNPQLEYDLNKAISDAEAAVKRICKKECN